MLDSDIKTACQQTCPTNAISFGNTNNPESQVSQMRKDPRAYTVIAEVNTRPQVTYFTKLRNRPTRDTDMYLESHGEGHGETPAEEGGHHS